MNPKNIVILGSTGSIGENAVKVINHFPNELKLYGISAKNNVKKLAKQALDNSAKFATVSDEKYLGEFKSIIGEKTTALAGEKGLIQMATDANTDMILCSIVGTNGLIPVIEAIKCGKNIALASKEILVMAGDIVMSLAKKHNVKILPVDSEHSAVFQCLEGKKKSDISKIILTASGGPFKGFSQKGLKNVSVKEALNHPTWRMGQKVSIDSATMMNKALEVIEARWLFDVPVEKIKVVIHPQSIIHSMVEFIDGTVLAQMSLPDMKYPIQNALTYPHRHQGVVKPLDFAKIANLTFEEPDHKNFPSLKIAESALKTGGTMPVVLNAANEIAVDLFMKNLLSFTKIWMLVQKVMEQHNPVKNPSLEEILASDNWARRKTEEIANSL